MSFLYLSKIIAENWLQNKTFSVLELACALHHSVFPVSNVNVTIVWNLF